MRTLITTYRTKILLAFGIFFIVCAFSPGRIFVTDVGIRNAIGHALWTEGTVFLPKGHHFEQELLYLEGKPGGTSLYSIGQSLVLIPFDMIGTWLADLSGTKGRVHNLIATLPILYLYAPLLAVMAFLLLISILEQIGFSLRQASFSSLCLTVSTIWFVYASQNLQEEVLAGTFALTALWNVARWGKTERGVNGFWAGFFLGASINCRMTAVFVVPTLLGFTIDLVRANEKLKRALVRFFISGIFGILIPTLVCIGFSYWRFNTFSGTGYHLVEGAYWKWGWGPIRWDYVRGIFFGAGKGLFILSPILVFAILGFRRMGKEWVFLASGILLSILLSVVIHSKVTGIRTPDGAESWGTRFQVHLLPLLLIPVAFGIQWAWKHLISRVILLSVVCLGVFFQIMACAAPDSLEYCWIYKEGLNTKDMISSPIHGQLGMRIRNVLEFTRGGTLDHLSKHCSSEGIQKMYAQFIPHIWGRAYASSFSGQVEKLGIWALWLMTLVCGLWLLVTGFQGTRLMPKITSYR